MMQQHIDRSRQTKGGMTVSFILHAGLLFLLTLAVGAKVASQTAEDELMEIAYIEARYGEDVAAKVKLKEKLWRPEPAGRGVNTDSAMQPPESSLPPRQDSKPLSRPELPVTQPVARQQVAEVAAPTIEPVTQNPQVLAQAPALEAKAPRPKARQVIDASKLRGQVNVEVTDAAPTPARSTARPQGQFKPQEGALKSKAGGIVSGGEVLASAGTPRTSGVVDGPAAVAAGGSLESNSRGTYAAPGSSLAPKGSGGGKAGGKGVVDVTGPSGTGGKGSGRKTILNYGSGSGGRGGGLSGRGRLAEPEPTSAIVKKAQPVAEPKQPVAEVPLDGKGVGMSISGQISGRKILQRVSPEYTAQARQKGWEGVVAVHFTVLADGRVKDNTYFEQSSVHRDLNQMALKAIKQFRFAPLAADQAAVEQWGVITIVFRLN